MGPTAWPAELFLGEGNRKEGEIGAVLPTNLPVGMVEPSGSSPGRGEGLPIFLPLDGESW